MGSTYSTPKQPKVQAPPIKRCGGKCWGGELCRNPAGKGTDHVGYGKCKLHMGNTMSHRKKAAGEMALDELVVMGLPLDVDPMDAILTCIRVAAGEVVYCTNQVHDLTPKQAVVRHKKTVSRAGDLDSYEEVEKSTDVSLNIWIQARHAAMERLVKWSKMAIDCGIAERQVKVAETTGQMLGTMLQAVLNELGLTDEQKKIAPGVVQKNLQLLEAAQAEKLES